MLKHPPVQFMSFLVGSKELIVQGGARILEVQLNFAVYVVCD